MTDIPYQRQMIDGMPVVAAPAEIDITTADQLHAALLHATRGGHPDDRGGPDPHPVL